MVLLGSGIVILGLAVIAYVSARNGVFTGVGNRVVQALFLYILWQMGVTVSGLVTGLKGILRFITQVI